MGDIEPDGGVYLVDEDDEAMYTRRAWGDEESLLTNVVAGLAEVTGKRPDEIEPIQNKVDVDAVESLFQNDHRIGTVTGIVTFEHEGRQISIDSEGYVEIRQFKQ